MLVEIDDSLLEEVLILQASENLRKGTSEEEIARVRNYVSDLILTEVLLTLEQIQKGVH